MATVTDGATRAPTASTGIGAVPTPVEPQLSGLTPPDSDPNPRGALRSSVYGLCDCRRSVAKHRRRDRDPGLGHAPEPGGPLASSTHLRRLAGSDPRPEHRRRARAR